MRKMQVSGNSGIWLIIMLTVICSNGQDAALQKKWPGSLATTNFYNGLMYLKEKAAAHIESCYDPVRKVYRHAKGSPHLDASTLQLIMMNFIDPASQKARDHLDSS